MPPLGARVRLSIHGRETFTGSVVGHTLRPGAVGVVARVPFGPVITFSVRHEGAAVLRPREPVEVRGAIVL